MGFEKQKLKAFFIDFQGDCVNICNETNKIIKVFPKSADINNIHNNSNIGKDMICR